MNIATAPLLVFGWGNPSRGDDALGPLFVERLAAWARIALPPGVLECHTDFQLQVEHALDLAGRRRVLFVDAAAHLDRPCTARPLQPGRGAGISSHALAPEAVLQVYQDLHGHPPPPSTLLAIRAQSFGLGNAPGEQALADLEQALAWARHWITDRNLHEEMPA
ncbi:MAG: hydrogenase maturation protease [Burkholderiaceae bacterium]